MKIEGLWQDLCTSGELPAFRRVDESHPLNIYAGISVDLSPLLLLVSSERISLEEDPIIAGFCTSQRRW